MSLISRTCLTQEMPTITDVKIRYQSIIKKHLRRSGNISYQNENSAADVVIRREGEAENRYWTGKIEINQNDARLRVSW